MRPQITSSVVHLLTFVFVVGVTASFVITPSRLGNLRWPTCANESKEPIYGGEMDVIESISVCTGKDCRARGGGQPLLDWLQTTYSPPAGQVEFTACGCMDECAVGPNVSLNKKSGMQVSESKFKKDGESVKELRERIEYIESYAKQNNPPRR